MLLRQALTGTFTGAAWEVGAGRALLPELLGATNSTSGSRVVSDVSIEMLHHSDSALLTYYRMVVADGTRLPTPDASLDLVVSSLGDPYNGRPFWKEAARVLRPGGQILFTTPSFEWALAFRGPNEAALSMAEFALGTGGVALVRSLVLPAREQCELIAEVGLFLERVEIVCAAQLRETPLSPKLRGGVIVTAYHARKLPR